MKFFRSRAGESCVVTGGAGGIGAASASLWLRCGGCAVIADVDAAAGAAFVARAPGPGRAVFVACDTRRREDLENAIAVAKCAYYVLLRIIILFFCFSLFLFPLLFSLLSSPLAVARPRLLLLFSFLCSRLSSPLAVARPQLFLRRREDLENAIAVATCAYYYCVLLSCFSLFLFPLLFLFSFLSSLLPSPWLTVARPQLFLLCFPPPLFFPIALARPLRRRAARERLWGGFGPPLFSWRVLIATWDGRRGVMACTVAPCSRLSYTLSLSLWSSPIFFSFFGSSSFL